MSDNDKSDDDISDYFNSRLDCWAKAFYGLVSIAGKALEAGDGEPMRKLLDACVPCIHLVCDCTPPGPIAIRGVDEGTNGPVN